MSLTLPSREGLRLREGLAFALLAGTVGYVAESKPLVGVGVALLPLVAYLLLRPSVAAAAMIVSIPVLHNVVGNDGGGVNFGIADVLAAITVAGVFPLVCVSAISRERLRGARPMLLWAAPFLGWLVVLVAAHPSLTVVLNTAQDFELVAVALVIGAGVLERRHAAVAVWGMLGVIGLDGLIWLTTRGHSSFAGNKNAVGQYFAYGILLLLALRGRWWVRGPLLVLCIGGLFFSASRGAMVGLAAGAIALLAFRGLGSWRRTVAAVALLSSAFIVGYNVIPASLQVHVQSILHGGGDSADKNVPISNGGTLNDLAYNVQMRDIYRRDGLRLWHAHPLLGVGVGNYASGSGITAARDPHNVLVRDLAEGGTPDAVAFVVMVLGTGYVALRRRRRNPWAGVALAMQTSMLAHAMLDVYWVRGLPMVAWVFLGMAVNPRLDHDAA